MNYDKFEELMDVDVPWKKSNDDRAILGLLLIRKYLPKAGIEGADHDIIYSVDVEKLIESGITEDDIIELRNLGWMIEDNYLAKFV